MNTLEQVKGTGKEIEIRKIVILLIKRFWVIACITGVTTAAGIYYNDLNKPIPIYENSSRIIIHENPDFRSSSFNTVRVMITEYPVLQPVIDQLELERSADALRNQIKVETVEESRIIKITVTDSDPEVATNIANTVPVFYGEVVTDLFAIDDVEILSEAVLSENPQPINPPSNQLVIISFVFGIVAGIGFVFLLDSMDNTVRSERTIEKMLELPVLGSVSKINKKSLSNKKKKKSSSIRGDSIGSS